jgi:hypothetical protein
MLDSTEDINKLVVEKALERIEELSKPNPKDEQRIEYPDGRVYDGNGKLIAEDPTEEQEQWIKFRLTHSNTWYKVQQNKIGDYKNWE